MLAKRTSKNQVTLPKAIVQTVGEADYYDVTVQDGKIVLTPVRLQQADAVLSRHPRLKQHLNKIPTRRKHDGFVLWH